MSRNCTKEDFDFVVLSINTFGRSEIELLNEFVMNKSLPHRHQRLSIAAKLKPTNNFLQKKHQIIGIQLGLPIHKTWLLVLFSNLDYILMQLN